MPKPKKPYVSPKVEFYPASSPAYNRLQALLEVEMNTSTEIPKNSHSVSNDESLLPEICVGE